MLPTDQVQALAREFDLSWRDIYQLDAEFQSLVKIECSEIQQKLDLLLERPKTEYSGLKVKI